MSKPRIVFLVLLSPLLILAAVLTAFVWTLTVFVIWLVEGGSFKDRWMERP